MPVKFNQITWNKFKCLLLSKTSEKKTTFWYIYGSH